MLEQNRENIGVAIHCGVGCDPIYCVICRSFAAVCLSYPRC
jgi:hypothetical protein